jgi:hypothetical protein
MIQRFQDSKISGFKDFRIQRFQDSKISMIQRFQDFRIN